MYDLKLFRNGLEKEKRERESKEKETRGWREGRKVDEARWGNEPRVSLGANDELESRERRRVVEVVLVDEGISKQHRLQDRKQKYEVYNKKKSLNNRKKKKIKKKERSRDDQPKPTSNERTSPLSKSTLACICRRCMQRRSS